MYSKNNKDDCFVSIHNMFSCNRSNKIKYQSQADGMDKVYGLPVIQFQASYNPAV